jgi:hypothetical protein
LQWSLEARKPVSVVQLKYCQETEDLLEFLLEVARQPKAPEMWSFKPVVQPKVGKLTFLVARPKSVLAESLCKLGLVAVVLVATLLSVLGVVYLAQEVP